jgi:transcription antitermination factor NusG
MLSPISNVEPLGRESSVAVDLSGGESPKMAADYPWFAIRVKSQCERLVSDTLRQRGYEEFFPQYWSRRLWSDRVKLMQRPLFAGYIFCRFDVEQRRSILDVPGVFHIVGQGKRPLPIELAEIENLRVVVQSGQTVGPWAGLEVGRMVRIEVGPLSGIQGMLLRFKGTSHLILGVKLLNRSVAVQVDESWVVPLETNYNQQSLNNAWRNPRDSKRAISNVTGRREHAP